MAIIGFDGHFHQNGDFFFRNPIYSDLIRYDWPLVFPDGNLFVYYFGFWLPPSLAAKFLPQSWHPYLLWFWSLAGMVLFTGSMAIQLKKKILIFGTIYFSLVTLSYFVRVGTKKSSFQRRSFFDSEKSILLFRNYSL